MNTFDGYIRRNGTNSKVLLDGGNAKALSEFIGTISYANNKITYTKADGTSYDLINLSNYIYNLGVATSDSLGGIRIGFSQSGKNYPVQLDSNNKAYVYVPWEENSHYTTRLYVGDGTAENKITTNGNTRITVTDNNNVRNYITLIGSGATNISSDDNGKITINSINTTYNTGDSATLNKGTNTEGKLWSAKTLVDYISDILGVDSTAITSLNTLIGLLHDNDTATGILVELAKKLNTPSSSIGNNTQPIYWNGSSFTTIGYTIEKSVPSNAIFTDTKYSFYVGENNNTKEHKNVSNPYFKLFENNTQTSIQIKAGTGISVNSDTNGNIIIKNESPDLNHNTWRPIKIEGTEKLGSATNTDALDLTAGNGIEVSYDSTNKKVIIKNTKPDLNHDTHYTTSMYIGENNDTKANKAVNSPYFKLFDNDIRRSTLRFIAGSGIGIASDDSGNITITNSSPDKNHNTDKTGIKLGTISGTKKTDSTVIINNSSTGLTIAGGTNKFSIGDGTNYIEIPITPSFTVTNKDSTIGTSLTTIATIAGTDIKAKIDSYLPLSGGTMTGHLTIKTSSYRDLLTIYRNENNNNSVINFSNKDGFLGAIGFTGLLQPGMPEKPHVVLKDGTLYTLLHSGNYNDYAPTKTGTGASGTWGINISGNADTVDNYHASELSYGLFSIGYNRNGPYFKLIASRDYANDTYSYAGLVIDLYSSSYTDKGYIGRIQVRYNHQNSTAGSSPSIRGVDWLDKTVWASNNIKYLTVELNKSTKYINVYLNSPFWDSNLYVHVLEAHGFNYIGHGLSLGDWVNLPTASSNVILYEPSVTQVLPLHNTTSTVATGVGDWSPISGKEYVYRQTWSNSAAGGDSADFSIYLDGNLTANFCLDGYYYSNSGFKVNGGTSEHLLRGDGGTQVSYKFGLVYNSFDIGNSSTVTVNDLAKGGSNATFGMIGSATDSPIGETSWFHVWSLNWGRNANTSWVSQIAIGTQKGTGLYYRTNGGNTIIGKEWTRVLDSANWSSYITNSSLGAHPLNGKISIAGGGYSWNAIQQYNSSDLNPSYFNASCAIININSYTGWQPWIRCVDIENGSWALGQYRNFVTLIRFTKDNTSNYPGTYNWNFNADGSFTASRFEISGKSTDVRGIATNWTDCWTDDSNIKRPWYGLTFTNEATKYSASLSGYFGVYIHTSGGTSGPITLGGRVYPSDWIEFSNSDSSAAYRGLYWPNTNGEARFYPNNISSYGTFVVRGKRGSYNGIYCGAAAGGLALMSIENSHQGLYTESIHQWLIYQNAASNDKRIGIGTATLASGYKITLAGPICSTSNIYIQNEGGCLYLNKGCIRDVSGNLIVGKADNSTGSVSLGSTNVASTVVMNNSEGKLTLNTNGTLTATSTCTATAFYASSDSRLKNIISDIQYSSEEIASLRSIKYTWKNKNKKVHIGSIALDVERIIPEVVNIDNEGYKSLDYATLGAIGVISLAREIVELKKEIKELKSKLYG